MNCALLLGLALNANSYADPEVEHLDNPWDSARMECERDRVRLYAEHNTSILVREEGGGINKVGLELTVIEW